MRRTGFAYAQARMQARMARAPTALDWQLIETGRDFSQTLDTARRTALDWFVTRLSRESGPDEIEAALRQSWAELVEAVAGWVPAPWRPALRQMTPLPHLRAIGAGRWDAGGMAERMASGQDATDAWRAAFDDARPGGDAALDAALAPLLARYLSGPPRPAGDADALATALHKTLRTRPQEPAAAFAWLGLMALTAERLRGALLTARLFGSGEG